MTLTEFRALAERATPGPWSAYKDSDGFGGYDWTVGEDIEKVAQHLEKDDAAWIAAASPTAIIALIDRLEGSELSLRVVTDRLEEAEDALRPFADAVSNPDAEVDDNDYLRAAAYFDAPAGEGEG